MRKALLVATVVWVALGGIAMAAAQARGQEAEQEATGTELDVRDIVGDARISLVDAVAAALKARPGRAVEAELEAEMQEGETDFAYEVMIVTDDNDLHEVKVDPRDGTVQADEEEADSEELEELAGFVAALRYSDKTLAELVDNATALVKGTPVAAELGMEGANPEADVLFANGRYLVEVGLEARAGQIVEVEMEGLPDRREDACSCRHHPR